MAWHGTALAWCRVHDVPLCTGTAKGGIRRASLLSLALGSHNTHSGKNGERRTVARVCQHRNALRNSTASRTTTVTFYITPSEILVPFCRFMYFPKLSPLQSRFAGSLVATLLLVL